jgi:ABC-type dipeptide/oligopeptide/nickel transport system permease subunit
MMTAIAVFVYALACLFSVTLGMAAGKDDGSSEKVAAGLTLVMFILATLIVVFA